MIYNQLYKIYNLKGTNAKKHKIKQIKKKKKDTKETREKSSFTVWLQVHLCAYQRMHMIVTTDLTETCVMYLHQENFTFAVFSFSGSSQ